MLTISLGYRSLLTCLLIVLQKCLYRTFILKISLYTSTHIYFYFHLIRSDCEQLLTNCLSSYKPYNVHTICATILPNNNQSNCISLKQYAASKSDNAIVERAEVTLPCRDDPCAHNEVCIIDQDCLREENSIYPCNKYKCIKGEFSS